MNRNIILSLCVPTNGISEWVVPTLESIYNQNISEDIFEVVVTDNGNNEKFLDEIQTFVNNHRNLVYKKTDSKMFLNQVCSFSLAQGEYIKFINHRGVMLPGSIQMLLEYVDANRNNKPITFWSNGALKKNDVSYQQSFDEFVYKLGHWSTWSLGLGIWKTDFDNLGRDISYNTLFPHLSILFAKRKRTKYIIDDRRFCQMINDANSTKKGNYDLFNAFSVEFPNILYELQLHGDISKETYDHVMAQELEFISDLYEQYILNKEICSYDLSGYEKTINIYFSHDLVMAKLEKRKLEYLEASNNLDDIQNNKDVVALFGACENGIKAAQAYGLDKVFCFIDNNEKKQGKMYSGMPVIGLNEFSQRGFGNKVKIKICVSQKYIEEIIKQLEDVGINKYTR